MASIAVTLGRIKSQQASFITPSLVESACATAGYLRGVHWRERVLGPVLLLRLFALQVMHGNVSCRTLRMLGDTLMSTQAYCAARMNLPVDVLGHVASALTARACEHVGSFGRWKGRRVLHIDGSGLSMPDTPGLQQAYGQPGRQLPGVGFPVMHVLWLFDAATGLICDFISAPWNTHDLAHASALHAQMGEGDVLVGDRAFGSFAHLALLIQQKLHGLFRVHQRQIVDFGPRRRHRRQCRKSQRKGVPTSRWVRTLGHDDQIVEYVKPSRRPGWMSERDYARLPDTLTLRELRYRVTRPGYRTRQVTLVTTLTDPRKGSKEELAQLYQTRWQIETNLRHLKQTMRMDVLRSRTTDGVAKELWMFLIVYNQVRLLMLDAAQRQGVAVDRISFIDTLDALRHHGPPITATLTLTVNPHRPGRHEPRVVKRRKDRYSYMTQPRDQLRKHLEITSVAA